jgi:hypothetical protein
MIWCFPRNNSPFSLYSDGALVRLFRRLLLASAAFSPPLISRRPSAASIPHRASALRKGADGWRGKKREGAIPIRPAPCRRACTRRSRARRTPWCIPRGARACTPRDPCGSRPRSGSCMRRSTARIRHPCALRCALVSRSASRRIRRQGVHKKALTGG